MPTFASTIFDKCTLGIGTGSELCGGFTLCDIAPTTSSDLANIYQDASDRGRIIGQMIEADFLGRACGTKRNLWYDLFMSRARFLGPKRLGMKPINRGLVEVMPFVQMARKGPINNNTWQVSNGTASSGTAPNGTAYTHRFDLLTSENIPNDVRWFAPKTQLFIFGRSAGGSATRTQWDVVDAEVTGGKVRVYATSVNANSALDSAKLGVPSTGIATRGVPNVSPYERYCTQVPGLNTNQRALFWVQDTRLTLCNDELTEKYISMLRENNPYYREFGDVESVEYNRQQAEDFQRRMVETWFWQKPLANQTAANWDDLETIESFSDDSFGNYVYLPGIEGRCVGRRANAVGFYEQLAECDRVFDLQGQVLNIPEFLQVIYAISRTRKSNSLPSDIIEVMTDSWFFTQLNQGLFNYKQNRWGGSLRATMDVNTSVTKTDLGLSFVDWKLDYPAGVTLRIVTHEAFDDFIDAHTDVAANLEAPSRMMWILEPNTNYIGIIDSETVTLRTGDIKRLAEVNEDALCRMKVISKSVKHTSTKFTVICECPGASLIIENIADQVPEHEGTSGSETDLYGAYTA